MTDFTDDSSTAFAPIDFRAELNDEQYAAVTAKPGAALVLAGAGSGKTRTLTYRVAYLLYKGVKPYEILLLTFTNKSANEMLDRVENLTGIGKQKLTPSSQLKVDNSTLSTATKPLQAGTMVTITQVVSKSPALLAIIQIVSTPTPSVPLAR